LGLLILLYTTNVTSPFSRAFFSKNSSLVEFGARHQSGEFLDFRLGYEEAPGCGPGIGRNSQNYTNPHTIPRHCPLSDIYSVNRNLLPLACRVGSDVFYPGKALDAGPTILLSPGGKPFPAGPGLKPHPPEAKTRSDRTPKTAVIILIKTNPHLAFFGKNQPTDLV